MSVEVSITPKLARERKGLSRQELAVTADIGYNTVCRCEQRGHWPVRIGVRRRYLQALDLIDRCGTVVPARGYADSG